ncbi:hypothetical protein QLQ12_40740 [Actinoplanes sp. NEAU-A12]|uniref:Uncharacterized protein n=1 Tax=Actinoplanes sandaracinus TaxID=3045177 RepID=A0ABT6WYV7_9ACTN|nr:hypothetical protein [Actinoplanes sandaracinus]MDI6104933.1 hypothetical protein [Actinoplanes sandaracinus]
MRIPGTTPATVRVAFVSWLVAVGAGVLETALMMTGEEPPGDMATGLAVRSVVFVTAVAVAWQMLAGRRWARLVLAAGLGVVGLSSLVADPIAWLAGGGSFTGLLAESGPADLVFGVSRTIHTLAVLTATALMFTPPSNAYFRRGTALLTPLPRRD